MAQRLLLRPARRDGGKSGVARFRSLSQAKRPVNLVISV